MNPFSASVKTVTTIRRLCIICRIQLSASINLFLPYTPPSVEKCSSIHVPYTITLQYKHCVYLHLHIRNKYISLRRVDVAECSPAAFKIIQMKSTKNSITTGFHHIVKTITCYLLDFQERLLPFSSFLSAVNKVMQHRKHSYLHSTSAVLLQKYFIIHSITNESYFSTLVTLSS